MLTLFDVLKIYFFRFELGANIKLTRKKNPNVDAITPAGDISKIYAI